MHACTHIAVKQTDRQTDRQPGRQTGRQTDRQTTLVIQTHVYVCICTVYLHIALQRTML